MHKPNHACRAGRPTPLSILFNTCYFRLWRYADRWCRWRRAGLDGMVSLKGGLRRVVIRQLRALGTVGFPIPDIRCPYLHLVAAEGTSLRLSFCGRRVVMVIFYKVTGCRRQSTHSASARRRPSRLSGSTTAAGACRCAAKISGVARPSRFPYYVNRNHAHRDNSLATWRI